MTPSRTSHLSSGTGHTARGRADEPRREISITASERSVLRLIARGKTVASIADELQISERTVRRRVQSVCTKLDVSTSIEAVVLAVRIGAI